MIFDDAVYVENVWKIKISVVEKNGEYLLTEKNCENWVKQRGRLVFSCFHLLQLLNELLLHCSQSSACRFRRFYPIISIVVVYRGLKRFLHSIIHWKRFIRRFTCGLRPLF